MRSTLTVEFPQRPAHSWRTRVLAGHAQVSLVAAIAVVAAALYAVLALVFWAVSGWHILGVANGAQSSAALTSALLLILALALALAILDVGARRSVLVLAALPGIVASAVVIVRLSTIDAGQLPTPLLAAGIIACSLAVVLLVRRRWGAAGGLAALLGVASMIFVLIPTSVYDAQGVSAVQFGERSVVVALLTLATAIAAAVPNWPISGFDDEERAALPSARLLQVSVVGGLFIAWISVLPRSTRLFDSETAGVLSDLTSALLLAVTVLVIAALFLTRAEVRREHVQKRLRAAVTRLRELYDGAPCGYQSLDAAGCFGEVNQTMCTWLGYEREELVGRRTLEQLVAAEDRVAVLAHLASVREHGGPAQAEFDLLDRSGTRRPVVMVSTAVAERPGEPPGLRQVLTDRTERHEAERQRTSADRRYRRIVETAEEGVWMIGSDSRTTFVNSRMAAMLGYAPEEMLGHPLEEFMDDEGRAIAAANIERRRRGVAEQHDFRLQHKDGSALWTIISTNPFVEEDGSYGGALAMVTDVTERKVAELALRDRKAQLQEITDQSPALVFSKDLQLRYTLVNHGFEVFYGRPREQLLGRTDAELMPAEVAAEMARTDALVLESGESLQVEQDFPMGSQTRTFLTTKSRLLDADGAVRGICGAATDITERKAAEVSVRESASYLRSITDQAPSMIFTKDLDLRFTLVNQEFARFHGQAREDVVGRRSSDVLPEAEAEEADRTDRLTLASDVPLEFEMRMLQAGGRVRTVLTTKARLLDDSGLVTGLCCSAIDITDRKSMEEATIELNASLERRVADRTLELKSANSDLAGFSYSVAHDLRGPLRAMHGFSSIVLDQHAEGLDAEAQRYLRLVVKSADDMAQVIDDLLVFARLGFGAVEREEVDLTQMIDGVLADLRAEGEQNTAAVELGPLPSCNADPRLLPHALRNLLSNALKFSRRSVAPHVVVETCTVDGGQAYVVRDNGVGFDPVYAEKMFGVFERLHASEDFEGTGLGLAIVKRVIDRHGGRVWAESAPGEGASVFFTLGE